MSRSEAKQTYRFKDGFGSISAVAAVLAEVICGMSLVEARQADKASFGALSERDKHEARWHDLELRRYPELRPSTRESRFGDKQRELTTALLAIAAKEGWIITDGDGVLQIPPRAFGVMDVRLVRDWFGQSKGHNHLAFAEALTQALQGHCNHGVVPLDAAVVPGERPANSEVCLRDPECRGQREGLTTGQIGAAFAFLPRLKKWLGETKHHKWVLPAQLSKGAPPVHATWCPVELAKLLVKHKDVEMQLNEAFLTNPMLRRWLAKWQEDRRERNAFGQ